MASHGNPNQQGGSHLDLQKLFKPSPNPLPTNPQSSLISSPSLHTPSPSASSSSTLPSSASYPPPSGPYPFHHLHYPPFPTHQPQQFQEQTHLLHPHQMQPLQRPNFSPPSPTSSSPSGARLMALLGAQGPSSNLDWPQSSAPFPPSSSSQPPSSTNPVSEFSMPLSSAGFPANPSAPPPNIPFLQPSPARLLSSKLPKGRHLIGDNVVYDIDVRLPGEVQPQLEVTPITKYGSDPELVLGRQIAVNRSYICYGLKLGAIRVLNINTAQRSLLRGYTQRVTDMAFFAEDLHLLASASTDGRVYIWKINEGLEEADKPPITGQIVIAVQIVGMGESVHPQICWHPHKQEILMVSIGNRILKIDTTKAGRGEKFSAEEPLKCPIDKPINGINIVGEHDGDITELSMSQWMKSRLASASIDGMVKIWEDRKSLPLAVLRPHNGKPVHSVTFLTAPHRPDHIVLITAGPLNREVKIWVSESEEGWLLPSDSESWNCTQTLDIQSSSEVKDEEAFFNQVVALPRAGLFLLANAKKNAIYAIHIEYGPNPAATRMDYIAEFTVTMPILSLTGTSDSLPDGEQIVQIYCVQTQAIQQYALDLSLCLPPPVDNMESEKTEVIPSRAFDASYGPNMELPVTCTSSEVPVSIATSAAPILSSSPDSAPLISASFNAIGSGAETKITDGAENIHPESSPLPVSPKLSQKLSGFRNPSNNLETIPTTLDKSFEQAHLDCSSLQRRDSEKDNTPDLPQSSDGMRKNDKVVAQNDISVVPNSSTLFKPPTHLVTPSELFSPAGLSSESSQISQGTRKMEMKAQDVAVNNSGESVEPEVKVIGETASNQDKFDYHREAHTYEKKEKSFYSQASDMGIEMAKECCVGTCHKEEVCQTDDISGTVAQDQPSNNLEEEARDMTNGTVNVSQPETPVTVSESTAPAAKGKRQKGKSSLISGPSSHFPSPFNSTGSSIDQGGCSGGPSVEAALPQLVTLQEMMSQLMTMQKEMQKQMNVMVSVPVTKEGKRLEGSLSRSMEKVVKANSDALWARLQEENAKQEKLERDRTQQMTNLITNYFNKDLPTVLEKMIKKELSSIGPAVARSISQTVEKAVSSAVTESFQKGVGEKGINQLEKSVNSKLEMTVARQIQAQFQTSGKQALQDALKTSLEASIIPAFEKSCKAMFEQIDATFQKGLVEHTASIQQQYKSVHSPLVVALRDAMNSASSISQTLSAELLALGGNPERVNPIMRKGSNGLPDMAEAPVDPTKELSRLVGEGKFEEAFTAALHRSDVSIVSWLCSQVDLQRILSLVPLPLSQGVLLSLLQQLSCDINKETPRKLTWMTDVAAAINPADPMIAMHVRPICEQVYQLLSHQRNLPTTSPPESSCIRLLMHVVNSILMSCK